MPTHDMMYLDIILLLFLVFTAIASLWVKNLLKATILLGIFSLLMASQYLVLGAPDVAMTEAAVGAGVSTILFLLALFIVGVEEEKTTPHYSFLAFSVIGVTAAILTLIVFEMPSYGDPDAPARTVLSEYFTANSEQQIGIPNMVTSILASYRGFDTFGETIVIFTAALAVLLLLGRFGNEKSGSKR
jgi:multicomponent Na+:H+ antiporter subunit B